MDSVFVYLIDIPGKTNEIVTTCADGYTVYIDKKLTRERQLEVYEHALNHIRRNDFESDLSADEIEYQAHK